MAQEIQLDQKFSTGEWTLYYHSLREKRWTLETFHKIGTARNLREALGIFKELGDKLKRGMFFWMRDPIPPLWENYQNIRGGSYSLRGGPEEGPKYYKKYVLGSMLGMAAMDADDQIMGISISPKVLGQGPQQRIGFYVIKVWNRDAERFNQNSGIHLLDKELTLPEVLYTPHVEKKM
jgi:hypothetical protein